MLKDSVCLTPFTWLSIKEQSNLPEEVKGILGLTQGQISVQEIEPANSFELQQNILGELRNEGELSKKAFSTHFAAWPYRSWIDFGEWRNDGFTGDKSEATPFKINQGYFYAVEV